MNKTEQFAHHLIGTSAGGDDYKRRYHHREAIEMLRTLPDDQVLRGRRLWLEFWDTKGSQRPERLSKLWRPA